MGQYSPNLLVVGWPRGLDGQHTQQTHLAEEFADELGSRYDKRVIMQDEVLSSEEAQKRIDPKLPIRKQREKIDAIAAQIILEDYLREAK
jgi:putative transcription antitermination factor YqgF